MHLNKFCGKYIDLICAPHMIRLAQICGATNNCQLCIERARKNTSSVTIIFVNFLYLTSVLVSSKSFLMCKMEWFCVNKKGCHRNRVKMDSIFVVVQNVTTFPINKNLQKTKTCWYRCFVAINLCAIFLLQQRYFLLSVWKSCFTKKSC